jgi:parallel beta-helix repeat protein
MGRGEGALLFYIAPNGNDAWSGRLPAPNKLKNDGPFATLHQAIEAIRQLKLRQGGELKQPVRVLLRGGIYFLTEPLILTPEESGTTDCPISFEAYGSEKPIVSGGRQIGGWKPIDMNGCKLWRAEIPQVRGKEGEGFFRNLWINGHRCIRARHPNKGYLRIAELPDITPETPWNEGQTRFRFHEGDLKAWGTIEEGEAVVMNRWVESRLPITSLDENERLISFGKRSVFRLDPGDLYYIEHVFELLDAPGEWFFDRRKAMLYYMPLPGERMEDAEAIVPILAELLRLEGKPSEGRFVEHLSFRGLTFAHTDWYYSKEFQAPWPKPDVGGFPQAAIGVPGAIYGEGVRHCLFEGCTFAHLGNYALELTRGCQYNRIVGCTFFDLGAGGVKIGETIIRDDEAEQTYGNEINACHIYEGGRIFHSAVGIYIGQSYRNRIAHNHIHDFYYTGISIGWTWGYGKSLAKENIVEYNRIHHIGLLSDGDGPILSDMGGIYTLGVQPGTIIRFNLFHDIAGFRYGGWGIYFDEGSTNIVAEGNIVYRTTHGGFHQHYGRENIVRNNIFAFGRDAQIQRSRQEPHISFIFERNIVYWREGRLISGNINDFNFIFERNLYWQEGGYEIRFGNLSWDEWRERGMDKNSMIADPLFVAPDKGDFRLKPNSPAFKLGFKPIDLSQI